MPDHYPSRFEPFAGLPVAVVAPDDSGWQMRFLSTPLLQRLPPIHWQQLLQGMALEQACAGATLIEAGTAGDVCFVLRKGRARVHARGRTLALLDPGALFGEDALIAGGSRNASVTLLTDGAVGRLPAARFEDWLLQAVIHPLVEIGDRRPLWIERTVPVGAECIHVPLTRLRDPGIALPVAGRYGVIGGALRERWLAAFVLAQQGFDARPIL